MICILEDSDFSPNFSDETKIKQFMYAACGWSNDLDESYAGEIRIHGFGGYHSLYVASNIEALKGASLTKEVPISPYYIVQDAPKAWLCLIPTWSAHAVRKAMMSWARYMNYKGILITSILEE